MMIRTPMYFVRRAVFRAGFILAVASPVAFAQGDAAVTRRATDPPAQQRLDQLEQAMGNRLDALSGKPTASVAQRVRER